MSSRLISCHHLVQVSPALRECIAVRWVSQTPSTTCDRSDRRVGTCLAPPTALRRGTYPTALVHNCPGPLPQEPEACNWAFLGVVAKATINSTHANKSSSSTYSMAEWV